MLREVIAPADEAGTLLVEDCGGVPRYDRAGQAAWDGWSGPRLAPRRLLGESLGAAAALQCVAAVEAIRVGKVDQAIAFALGGNEQAAGARFGRSVR
jgi:hypothetical protein